MPSITVIIPSHPARNLTIQYHGNGSAVSLDSLVASSSASARKNPSQGSRQRSPLQNKSSNQRLHVKAHVFDLKLRIIGFVKADEYEYSQFRKHPMLLTKKCQHGCRTRPERLLRHLSSTSDTQRLGQTGAEACSTILELELANSDNFRSETTTYAKVPNTELPKIR